MVTPAAHSVMNSNFSITPIADTLQEVKTRVEATELKVIEVEKISDGVALSNQTTRKRIEDLNLGQVNLGREIEANGQAIGALQTENAALDRDMNTGPFGIFRQCMSLVSETVKPCLENTCYIIIGVVVGTVAGAVTTLATDKDTEAGAGLGALAGGAVVAVALYVNKICKNKLRCCSQ